MPRRDLLGLLGIGVALVATRCGLTRAGASALNHAVAGPPTTSTAAPTTSTTEVSTTTTDVSGTTVVASGGIPPPNPGPPRVISRAPGPTQEIALTIDDGYCMECARRYVEFAQVSGIHITFSPNGVNQRIWNPLAHYLNPLIELGQVQIGNHTYRHLDQLRLSDRGIVAEIERNEEWIESAFGITARPWFRPPYGLHDERTDEIAGGLGYTNILLWNGSFGDSVLLTPEVLMTQARKWLRPGSIMLGHANHPTVTGLFPEIQDLIAARELQPVTLDEMFGTSRSTG